MAFWQFTGRWELAGQTPSALCELRQANVPKLSKVSAEHLLDCKHLRPIAVYSIWWRIYTSCWAKSSCVRESRRQSLPHQICGGKGDGGAEELASRRVATSKEEAQQSARQTALMPVSAPAKHTTIRTCATSRAAYGWVSRSPTQKENGVHEQAAWNACRAPHFGGVHHKGLLLGLNLGATTGISQVLRMLAMASKDTSRTAEVCRVNVMRSNGWQSMVGLRLETSRAALGL